MPPFYFLFPPKSNWVPISFTLSPEHFSSLHNPAGLQFFTCPGAEPPNWSPFFNFTFHFQALEKEMATHSSVLAWRVPGTEEPGELLSMGSQRVTQTHVHRVGDAIQPSHPLSSPSPPAPNPSQHQSLFQPSSTGSFQPRDRTHFS